MEELGKQLDTLEYGTLLTDNPALTFTEADKKELSSFLRKSRGHGFVCTTLGKAANTFVVQCPKDYVEKSCCADFKSSVVVHRLSGG